MILDSTGTLSITHSATAHTNGLDIINSQAGGYGSALKFQSERSDNNAIVTAARIRTEGAEAWNADDAVSSAFIFESVENNSLTERARFASTGNLAINTTTATTNLNVQGDSTGDIFTIRTGSTANSNVGAILFRDGGADFCGQITCNGSTNTVAYNTSSDARLKNVLGKADGLKIINQLNPVHFEWKKSGFKQDGLIAQEVESIVPNAVTHSKDSDVYSIDYSKLVTPLIKAIQEQQEQIDALQSEINILKGE